MREGTAIDRRIHLRLSDQRLRQSLDVSAYCLERQMRHYFNLVFIPSFEVVQTILPQNSIKNLTKSDRRCRDILGFT